MDTFVRTLTLFRATVAGFFKRLRHFSAPSNEITPCTNPIVANDTDIDSSLIIQRRIEWIDEMIGLAPLFLAERSSDPHESILQNFFFCYDPVEHCVIFRVSDCPCGCRGKEARRSHAFGTLIESNWNEFWPLALGRLRYFSKHPNLKEQERITIISTPQHPDLSIQSCESSMLIAWMMMTPEWERFFYPSGYYSEVLNCAACSASESEKCLQANTCQSLN